MKVALVHDWLIHMRGGEKVLEALAEIFPDATIYTLFLRRSRLSPSLQRMKIKTSVLQWLPGIPLYYRWLLPLFPFFIRTLQPRGADLVISLSHCVAKGARILPGVRHICYCYTPMRYLWGFGEVYFGGFPKWARAALEFVFAWLREWDRATAQRVDEFWCISENVRKRIERVYGRDAQVIYPPVDFKFFGADSKAVRPKKDYYFVVSALTPYKRIDVAVEAFNGWDRELRIAGEGPLRGRYEKLARTPNIRFLGRVSNEELKRLYEEARALIFPPEEDFGIVPLEAEACGTPVIAFGRGGALETVQEGVFFSEQTPEAIRAAVEEFEKKTVDPDRLREWAAQFDREVFKDKMREALLTYADR